VTDGATSTEIEKQISEEIIQVHEESYGVGARRIVTHYLEDLVVVVIDVELTVAEKTLLDADKLEAVKASRESFQSAIGSTFTAAVERATGRRVESFVSHMNLRPPYSLEVFRLGPRGPRYQTA
jgi:uncharacterized protein YbcI